MGATPFALRLGGSRHTAPTVTPGHLSCLLWHRAHLTPYRWKDGGHGAGALTQGEVLPETGARSPPSHNQGWSAEPVLSWVSLIYPKSQNAPAPPQSWAPSCTLSSPPD